MQMKGFAVFAAAAAAGAAAGYALRRRSRARPQPVEETELNEPALEAKVETVLFRPEDAPKGSVVVNVEERRVVLRGQVESSERIEELVRRAEEIEEVLEVESLLHLPGEPAPTRT